MLKLSLCTTIESNATWRLVSDTMGIDFCIEGIFVNLCTLVLVLPYKVMATSIQFNLKRAIVEILYTT